MFAVWLVMFLINPVSNDDIFAKFHQTDYKFRFDRADVVWFDNKVFKHFFIKTFKYNRTLAVSNISFEPLIDFGYELLCMSQAYKFYSNEYRGFPIRLQLKFCPVLEYNLAGIGNLFARENPPCPLRKNIVYTVSNFYPDESLLPPLMPNGDFMAEIALIYLNKNVSIFKVYGTVYRPFVPKY